MVTKSEMIDLQQPVRVHSQNDVSEYCIQFEDVTKAYDRILGKAHVTPILTSKSINAMLPYENKDMKLFFKVEALQKTGSFKFRGALNATLSLMEEQIRNSNNDTNSKHEVILNNEKKDETTNMMINVVTHSSGNHAQALALAAQIASSSSSSDNVNNNDNDNNNNKYSIQSTIIMPRNAPTIKKNAVASYGGKIILVDNNNKARKQKAEEVVNEYSKTSITSFIHPSENPNVIAGQGTVALEMMTQMKESQSKKNGNHPLDILIIPVGGGGLASGNTIALRGMFGSNVRIVLAEPEVLDDAKRSKDAGKLLFHSSTNKLQSVADGLKTTLGPNTWPIIRDLVDDIITVSEKDILIATKLIWERLKIGIEPSAGVGVAVAMSQEFAQKYGNKDCNYENVGIILCGGNVDFLKVASMMSDIGL